MAKLIKIFALQNLQLALVFQSYIADFILVVYLIAFCLLFPIVVLGIVWP